jgi:aromatic ring hydroxylase
MSKNDQMGGHPQGEDVCRPMTGAEYLESLRDQREVWIYGERVKDVTLHPAFRNQARMVARMYDALHHPQTKALLTCTTDTLSSQCPPLVYRNARESFIL